MRGNSKGYFFVNKTADSEHLTQSPGDQWSEIQKHVQTGLKRPRKKGSATPRKAHIVDDKALYNSTIRCISTEFDPFGTASVDIDSTVRSLLHYYIYNYHPTIWTYNPELLSSKPYAFKSSVVRVINSAICDSLAMYSLLSASTSRIQHIDRLSFPSAVDKEHLYMGQALQLMQKRIDGEAFCPESINQIVLCIMFLGSAEAYRDNLAAAKIHLQTALKLLEPGGVMSITDKNLQGTLLMSDLFLACIDMSPCLCGYAYDPGPASTLNLVEEELLPFPEEEHGAAFLRKDGIVLPHSLRQFVRDILESYRTNCQLNVAMMDQERAFETTHWVTKRNMAIRARILAIPSDQDDRLFALKSAIIMWTLLAMNITGRIKTVKMMALQLKIALEQISSSAWRAYEDVNLWILLVGYCCARDGSSELIWFADQITEGNAWFCISDMFSRSDSILQALEAFLNGFLYHPLVQKSRIEAIAKLLELPDVSDPAEFTPSSSASFEVLQSYGQPW